MRGSPDGTPGFRDSFGKGGHVMTGPFGQAVVVNITSHPTKGIGAWSDAADQTDPDGRDRP